MNAPGLPELGPPDLPPARAKINWWVFFVALLGPTVLTILIPVFGATKGDTAPTVAFLGGVASGITCGVLLGRRVGSTRATQVALGVVFTIALGAACIFMNCFGCLAGGYQFTL